MTILSDIFAIRRGHNLDLVHCVPAPPGEGVAYISNGSRTNGVTGRILPDPGLALGRPGEITVALAGSALSTFMQDEPFVTGQNVAILTSKKPMGKAEKLWWVAVIRANIPRYSFGRKANRTFAALPVPDECPAHIVAMGDELPQAFPERLAFDPETVDALPPRSQWARVGLDERFEESSAAGDRVLLPPAATWTEFSFPALFELSVGNATSISALDAGETEYVSGGATDWGVSALVDSVPNAPSGTISVAKDGSVGYAAWRAIPYCASSHAMVLTPSRPISAAVGCFLAALIRLEMPKYSYGRAWGLSRMMKSSLRLPVTSTGEPDWDLIERYIKGLTWSKAAIRGD